MGWLLKEFLAILANLLTVREMADTKKKMTFVVKWVGFDEPTEEPYTNRSLFKTEAMHTYLKENNLKSLIPKAYKDK